MGSFILRNWLILAVTSFLVALYVWLFDGFTDGKAYMFLMLSLLFGGVYYWQSKKA
jgi:hypothetical protein